MILGIFIRNFKVYGKTTFIPLANGDYFTGLIGDNGVGKTTVLQALDCFFNDSDWIFDILLPPNKIKPLIQPVFLVPKEKIPAATQTEAEAVSDELWQHRADIKIHSRKKYLRQFHDLLAGLPGQINSDTHYLLTAGITKSHRPCPGVFPPETTGSPHIWIKLLKTLYRYIYIPTSPVPVDVMKLADPEMRQAVNQETERLCRSLYDTETAELLNSSEKLQLIILLLRYILDNDKKTQYLIGFDEPEATLQTSVCYDLFEKIYLLARNNAQVVLTSHWYGFIPLLTAGLLVNILLEEDRHKFLRFDISRFREEIKIRKRIYMEKYREELPVDVSLKSVNDFIQSLIGSVINKPFYNWLICEGSSEKIYFNYYFEEEIKNNRIRIVPVGGVREVKKIYNYLSIPFQDLKDYIQGNIVLLTDTDIQLLEFDTPAIEHLYCFRLVNYRGGTELVHIKSNPKSPATEIEDVLNGKAFHEALLSFKEEFPHLLDFVTPAEKPQIPSYYAMDLTPTQYEKMISFFDANIHNKVRFAHKYIEICRRGGYEVPDWIKRIKTILCNDPTACKY